MTAIREKTTKTTERPVTLRAMLPIISASTLGTSIEWYDFFFYGFLSVTVFPTVFFPRLAPFVGILASVSTNFIGFVARPLGGAFFGWFGDRIGRKATLFATLLLMGSSTMLMGVLPGYAAIGIAAPLLLSSLRFLQGIAVGGEWGGSVLLSLEYGDDRHRGFWTSWPQTGVPIGLALSALFRVGLQKPLSWRCLRQYRMAYPVFPEFCTADCRFVHSLAHHGDACLHCNETRAAHLERSSV